MKLSEHLQTVRAVSIPAGTAIFREGDAAREQIYFLFAGELSVTRKRADKVAEISKIVPGMFFGEVALINHIAHHNTATVTKGPARVGVIDRPLFDELCNTNPDFLHVLLKLAIGRLLRADDKVTRLTRTLDSKRQHEVDDARSHRPRLNIMDYVNNLLTKICHPGEYIFKEADPSDGSMYLVIDGTLSVLRHVEGKEEKIAELHPGDFFGEMALLNNQPRAASVKAEGKVVKLGMLDDQTFLKIARSNPPFLFEILKMVLARLVATEHLIDVLVTDGAARGT